jgi:hypothetical protein
LFTATAAWLLINVASKQVTSYTTALVGGTLFLLNFATANMWLSGFIDSAEGCCLMVLTWALFSNRWWLLPLCGAFGSAGEGVLRAVIGRIRGSMVARLQEAISGWIAGRRMGCGICSDRAEHADRIAVSDYGASYLALAVYGRHG